jgi:hypothetical protein
MGVFKRGWAKTVFFAWCFDGEFVVVCGVNVVLITTYFAQRKNATFLKYFYGKFLRS